MDKKSSTLQSALNMARYRQSSRKHSLSALLLYPGGGLFRSDTDGVNRMLYLESVCFFIFVFLRKATCQLPCLCPTNAPTPSFSPPNTLKLSSVLCTRPRRQFSTGLRKGWEDFLREVALLWQFFRTFRT